MLGLKLIHVSKSGHKENQWHTPKKYSHVTPKVISYIQGQCLQTDSINQTQLEFSFQIPRIKNTEG